MTKVWSLALRPLPATRLTSPSSGPRRKGCSTFRFYLATWLAQAWTSINGGSISPGGLASGTPSAVMWQKGTEGGVTDLNLFLSPSSSFVALLTAFGINDKGQIVGFGMTSSGDVHAFLANPFEHEDGDESVATGTRAAPANVALSQSVRRMISGRLGIAK
jgi:probable HAF family extracellular repeat protein